MAVLLASVTSRRALLSRAGTCPPRNGWAAMDLSAKEAATKAGEGPSVIGWALDRDQRAELLQQFPPKFVDVVADHGTLATTASTDAELPSETLGDVVAGINGGAAVDRRSTRLNSSH